MGDWETILTQQFSKKKIQIYHKALNMYTKDKYVLFYIKNHANSDGIYFKYIFLIS